MIQHRAVDIRRFTSATELVQAAAIRWIELLSQKPRLGTGLLGGRIAEAFFKELARQVTAEGADVSLAHFFWSDERCVPPTDPDSNYWIAEKALLDPLGIPLAHRHRIRGELSSEDAVAAADQELRVWSNLQGHLFPSLDLVLLGVGEDGHVASLFPGAALEVIESEATYVALIGPKPPPRRVSMTYRTIAAAREVWVLASGAGKELALRQSLQDAAPTTPLARVIAGRDRITLWTDVRIE